MDAIIVIKIDESFSWDATGLPVPEIRVQFKVGPHGPFTLKFPKATFAAESVRAATEEFGRQLDRLTL
jgi:hypothetical protein